MIKAIFFDYGGVLVVPATKYIYEELTKKGKVVEEEKLREVLWNEEVLSGPKGTLDLLLKTKYKELKLSSKEIITFFGKIPKQKKVWDIAHELKEKKISIALISDHIAEVVEMIRKDKEFQDLFERAIFSTEAKCSKNSKGIFDKAAEMADASPNELLLIDDHESVIDRAKNYGWQAILFKNPTDARNDYITVFSEQSSDKYLEILERFLDKHLKPDKN